MKRFHVLAALVAAFAVSGGSLMAKQSVVMDGQAFQLAKKDEKAKGKWEVLEEEVVVTKESKGTSLQIGKKISAIRFTCTDGSIIINTVWVGQGGEKIRNTLGQRFQKGDTREITTETSKPVDSIGISHDARGKYKVEIKVVK